MKTTDVLAQDAIAYSIKHHISREAALRELLKREKLIRPSWMTMQEAKNRRRILFRCILMLIPHVEPRKINAHYKGKIRAPESRLKRLHEKSNGKGRVPLHHSSDVAVEILRRSR